MTEIDSSGFFGDPPRQESTSLCEKLLFSLCVGILFFLVFLIMDVAFHTDVKEPATIIGRSHTPERKRKERRGMKIKHDVEVTDPPKWTVTARTPAWDWTIPVSSSQYEACPEGKTVEIVIDVGCWTGWKYKAVLGDSK